MEDLLDLVKNLINSETKTLVDKRINEFKRIGVGSINNIFKELSFCIMTANCEAKKCIEIQERIDDGFLTLSQEKLTEKLKENHYRFPNIRSNYIVRARDNIKNLDNILKTNREEESELRDWLVKNIKGIGYKEASHFLRNIGFKNYAIIDFHIIDLLVKYRLIEKPKNISKNKYLTIETILKNIGNTLDLNMAELDLYLWYIETGKILK